MINWRLIGHIAAVIAVAGLSGAYPYLNPSQFNWKFALAAFVVASAVAAASYLKGNATNSRLAAIEKQVTQRYH